MAQCDCIQLSYQLSSGGGVVTQELYAVGTFNGYNYWEFTDVNGVTYTIWWENSALGDWNVTTDGAGGIAFTGCAIKNNSDECPYYSIPVWTPNGIFAVFTTQQCVPNCDCIRLTIEGDGNPEQTFDLTTLGTYFGRNYWSLSYYGYDMTIFFDGSIWMITDGLGSFQTIYGRLTNTVSCPQAELGTTFNFDWIDGNVIPNLQTFTTLAISCPNPCPCLELLYIPQGGTETISVQFTEIAGIYNGYAYWVYELQPDICLYIYNEVDSDGCCQWQMRLADCGTQQLNLGSLIGTLGVVDCDNPCEPCPFGLWELFDDAQFQQFSYAETIDCDNVIVCNYLQDRHQRPYTAIKFPEIYDEPNRGWLFGCCDPMLVLAGGTETWENDVNSAWCKLSDPTDSVAFKLYKNGVLTTYQPTPVQFPNEPNAYYATIQWLDVLNSDGIGCYKWQVEYNIAGVVGIFEWGVYDLKVFSIENAKETARIRVKFNLIQAIEGINFTDSNVEDSLRFYGFIGERQPNMEIDNLIYQNREMKTVIRQNLNEYTIKTDPTTDDITRKMCDLYLLSENELYISDYNIFNHSYRYNDLPAIVQQTPEINYIDQFQRKAIVTCIVGDRIKNQRTFY